MSKRKPTVAEVRTLKQQLQDYIHEIIVEFEEATGITVKWIEVQHVRKPGYGEKETIKINVDTEL